VQRHADDVAHPIGKHTPAAAIKVELQDGAAFGLLVAAQVTGPADAEVDLASRLVYDEGARRVRARGWDAAGKDLALLVNAVPVQVAQTYDLGTVTDVEVAVKEGKAVGPAEALGDNDRLVGKTVAIAIGEGNDLLIVHIGHVQDAVVVEGHEARPTDTFKGGIHADREAGGQVEAQSCGQMIEVLGDEDGHWL